MGRWFGTVGYSETVETVPGVWEEVITERQYSGDTLSNSSRWSNSSDSTNDDLSFNKRISIVADPFAYQKFSSIKYVKFMGASWKVTSVDPQYPRLILTIGGVYNGQQT